MPTNLVERQTPDKNVEKTAGTKAGTNVVTDVVMNVDKNVDTRVKILGSDDAAAVVAAGAVAVSGHFDPLIAWHTRWLEGFRKAGHPLLVMITTPANPILPARARAELVAALRMVDYVVEFSPELQDLSGVIHLEKEDRELFQDLLELVHTRNSAMSAIEERR